MVVPVNRDPSCVEWMPQSARTVYELSPCATSVVFHHPALDHHTDGTSAIKPVLACPQSRALTRVLHIVHDSSYVARQRLKAAHKASCHQAASVQRAVHRVQDICCMLPALTEGAAS